MKKIPEKILVTGLVLVVFAIVTIIFISYKQSQKVHDTDAWIAHTSNVLYHNQKVLSYVLDNETGARGFALTGSDKYLDPLVLSEANVANELAELKKLTSQNKAQQTRIDSLTAYVNKRLAYSRRHITLRKERGLAAAMKLTESGEGNFYTNQVRLITSGIQQEENKLIEERRASNRHAITYLNGILTGLALLLFILLLIVFFIIRKTILLQKKSESFLQSANFALDKDVQQKTAQLAHIFERITDGFAALDSDWCYTYVNKRAVEILRHSTEELIGKNIWDLFPDSSNQPFYIAYHRAMEKQEYVYLEEYYPPMDLWLENHIYPSPDGLSLFFADITEKKKAAEKIVKANRLYNFISQVNQMIVHTTNTDTLFKKACEIAVNLGQFKLAWIGLVNEQTQQVMPVMFAGDDREYLSRIKKIKILNETQGLGPTGTAIREGKHIICHDIATDPAMAPWKDEALARGYQSSIAVPITKFGKVVGAFSIYAAEKHFFDTEETALILEATGDISFALEIFEKETLRQQAENSLKEQRDRFAKIAETSPGLIYSFNRRSSQEAHFNFPYAKNNIEDIFGFTSEDLEKDATIVVKSLHPDDRELVTTSIEESAKKLSPWKCAFRYIHPVKGVIWLEGHSIPKPEADGTITWFGVMMDITERKKAEQFIIESEQKYRAFFESSLDGIMLTAPDGSILTANPAACNIFGMTVEEICAAGREGLVDPADPNLAKLLEERKQTGKFKGEIMMVRKNGEKFIAENSSAVFKDHNGKLRTSMIIRDITAERKAARVIKESEEKYRTLVEQASDSIFVYDWQGKFTEVNSSAEKLCGYTKKELLSMTIFELMDPEHLKKVPIQFGDLLTGKVIYTERKYVKKDGSIVDVEVSSRLLSNGLFHAIARDITERKKAALLMQESEEKYRTLVEQASDAIFLYDKNGKFIDVNTSAEKLSGYSKKELFALTAFDLMDPEDIKRVPLQFDELQLGKITTTERKYKRKDGSRIDVEVSSKLLSNGYFHAIARNITERKKIQQELLDSNFRFEMITRATNDALWEWNFETGQLWGNATHQQLYGLTMADPVPVEAEWIKRIHPDDRHVVETQNRSLESDKSIFLSEYRFLNAENEYRYIYDRCYILRNEDKKPVRMVGSMMDVTEQKNAEKEIIESEKKFRNTMDKMLEGVQIVGFDWTYLYANDTAAAQGGVSKESVVGSTMFEKFPGVELTPVFKIFEECMLKRKPRFFVEKFKFPNKKSVWLELSVQPVPEGLFILSIDITERKKKEEEIRQSEEKRRLIMTAALDAIICMDTKGMITFWNPKAEEVFGWREKEVMGKLLSSIIVPEKYRAMHDAGIKKYLKTGKGPILNSLLELKAINKQQQEFSVELSITPIRQDNEEFFCAFLRDISERKRVQESVKKSEQQYRYLFNYSPMPKWIYDVENFKILEVNEAAIIHFGYSREQFTALTTRDISPVEDHKKYNTPDVHAVKAGTFSIGEWRLKKADGEIIDAEISGHPTEYHGRSAMMIISNDITERKKAAAVIENINKELHELSGHLQTIREEERVQIARDIHDELGQQLTGLKLGIEWLNLKIGNTDNKLKEKAMEMIALIKGTIQSVRRISANLRPSMLDDLGLVAALEWQSQEVEKRFGIMINFISEIPDTDLPIDVSTALFRIYQEALTNAVRHSGAHEINSLLQITDSNIILEIKDNGKGIDEEKRAATKSFGLLGIKERTFALGGTFNLQSEPGKGTFIKIVVPI